MRSAGRSVTSASISTTQQEGLPTIAPSPRTSEQGKRDALNRLEHDTDAWVATAEGGSESPYLMPLSFLWDGTTLLVATPSSSPTGHNLRASGKVRLGIGPTRDLVEGTVRAGDHRDLRRGRRRLRGQNQLRPRRLTSPYLYLRIHPQRLQAWREANELEGRELMRGGCWAVP